MFKVSFESQAVPAFPPKEISALSSDSSYKVAKAFSYFFKKITEKDFDELSLKEIRKMISILGVDQEKIRDMLSADDEFSENSSLSDSDFSSSDSDDSSSGSSSSESLTSSDFDFFSSDSDDSLSRSFSSESITSSDYDFSLSESFSLESLTSSDSSSSDSDDSIASASVDEYIHLIREIFIENTEEVGEVKNNLSETQQDFANPLESHKS